MPQDCITRLEELRHRIGSGLLRGSVEVDQVYAHYQHEHLFFRHPRGGGPLYLSTPLFAHFRSYLQDVAGTMLEDGGEAGMRRSMEHLSDQVEIYAPVEFNDLRRSGHPKVEHHGHLVYDRPPKQHRLSAEELRIKNRLRKLPPEIIGWIWWHVMHHQEPPPRTGGRRR